MLQPVFSFTNHEYLLPSSLVYVCSNDRRNRSGASDVYKFPYPQYWSWEPWKNRSDPGCSDREDTLDILTDHVLSEEYTAKEELSNRDKRTEYLCWETLRKAAVGISSLVKYAMTALVTRDVPKWNFENR